MNQNGESYSLKELCKEARVTERTVRYYIQEGLLPPPKGVGVFARYDQNHLLRLKLIRRLKEEYLPLAEIRNRLADLSQTELEDIATQSEILTAQFDDTEADAKSYLDNVLNKRSNTTLRSYLKEEQTDYKPKRGAPGASQAPASPASFNIGQPIEFDAFDAETEEEIRLNGEFEEWKRIKISDGVELHYQNKSPEQRKLVTQLLDFARKLFRTK
jgi:DNA-binding transcriptional MerR regulator